MSQPRDDTGRFAGRDVNLLNLRPNESVASASMNDEIRLAAGHEVVLDDEPAPGGGNFGGGQETMTGAGYVVREQTWSERLADAVADARAGR